MCLCACMCAKSLQLYRASRRNTVLLNTWHRDFSPVRLPTYRNVYVYTLEMYTYILLLLPSHFSSVRLCATPWTAAHQDPPSLGLSRQEHWSGLPFPSPMHASEKWKWSHSVVSNFSRPHGLQPARLLHPWDFPGKSTGVGCHCLLLFSYLSPS